MLSMAFTYMVIGKILWLSERIGEVTSEQRDSIKNKQKAVPMLIAVTVIFGFCWLPYQLYFIITYHLTELKRHEYIQNVYLMFYWLAMANSAINPVIYALINKRSLVYLINLIVESH